jgi:hypothetical protein
MMTWDRSKTIGAAVAVVLAMALAAGLFLASGREDPPGQPAAATRLLSPFTGEPVAAPGPVLAVKIDNLARARPQTGLGKADIVYLLAIFSSEQPPVAGPVRSAREADLELLAQFGRPAFGYSGATPELLPVVARARIVDLYSGRADGYFRDPGRPAPHNLYAHVGRLLEQARAASKATDIGFRFGPAPAGGRAVMSQSVSYPAASFAFTWSAGAARWLVSMDGTPAAGADDGQLSAATVVIQYTTVGTSRFTEYGSRPPYAKTTGSGDALVLRDGKAFQAHWSRSAADGGTTFTTGSGQPMTFAPGPVWVVLAAR